MVTIRTELICRNRVKTGDEAGPTIFSYVEGFYNPIRRHSTLGPHSPRSSRRWLWLANAQSEVVWKTGVNGIGATPTPLCVPIRP